jgi:AraC-like DNA-binding protein
MALLFYADRKSENITVDYEIPAHLRKLILPAAVAVYCSFENGGQLIQQLEDGPATLYLRNFFIRQRTALFPVSTSDAFILLFVLQGNIRCTFGCEGDCIFKEGYTYLLRMPAGLRHKVIFEPANYSLMHFDVVDAPFASITDSKQPAAVRTSLAMYGIVHDIQRPGLANAPPGGSLREKLSLLLSHFIKARDEPLKKESRNSMAAVADRLINAKELIDENEGKRLKIHEIARRCFLNEEQLKKGFLEMFGRPVNKYQTWMRMQRGRHLLITTNYSVHHISIDVGYDDPSSFADMFKKTFGTTPSKFRQSLGNTDG